MRRLPAPLIRIILALTLSLSVPVEAWQTLAHYQITIEAIGAPYATYSYLPDSWPSHGGLASFYGITEWFAWSHAVMLTGRTDGVPNVPRYPVVDREPGSLMYRLYKSGLGRGPDRYSTALGFAIHNAQDRVVHYAYFRGGSRTAWLEEHQYKEEWADCWIYRLYMSGIFDNQGRARLPAIVNQGNASLIAAAQAEFVRSKVSLDPSGRTFLPKVESESEVQSRFADGERDIRSYFNDFSAVRCRWLQSVYRENYDWTQDDLEDYYKRAVRATRQRRSQFPS